MAFATVAPVPSPGRSDMEPGATSGAVADGALVARIASGDERALSLVYDRYAPLVFGLALRVTRSDQLAQDIAQEVFAALWEQPERFDPARGTLRAYLGVLTHRRSVDGIRREEAARRRIEHEGRHRVEAGDLSDGLVADDVATRVRAAIADLPAKQREAVLLAYFGGRTYREVAVMLGIPEGTAKSRLRLALARLGAVLLERELTPWN